MSSLEELKKQLFRKKDTFQEREHEPTLSPVSMAGPRSWGSGEDPELERQIQKQRQRRLMRYALFATVGFAALALAGAAVFLLFLRERASVTKENIFLLIEGPSQITVGEEAVFDVRFANNNDIPLESVDIIFEYPEGARPVFGEPPRQGPFRERVSIGRLLPHEEHRESFRAYLFGNTGDALTARSTLEYRPQNSSARFGKDVSFAVEIARSPVGVAITMPHDATAGQEIEIVVDYVSTTESLLADVSLDMAYPSGFTFLSAEPAPSKDNNLWRLGNVPPGGEGHIRIRGAITGNAEESKVFTARIGLSDEETSAWSSYGQAVASLVMRDALLAITVDVAGSEKEGVSPGRQATFKIHWRNNLPVSARNVVLEATLSGAAIDYARVRSQNGSYDSANRRMVWTASQLPEFRFVEPGAAGSVEVSVPVLAQLPIQTLADKNFVVRLDAVFYTNTVPEGFVGVETAGKTSAFANVITQFGFASRGLYRDGVFANTGPLPPRAGKESTYTINWSVTSSGNDMENVSVRASLPANVQWKQKIEPAAEHVSYDPDTREVVWDTGFVIAGTGYTRPAREVSFQVGLVPGVSDVGRMPVLVSSAAVAGIDTFTGFRIEEKSAAVTTHLLDDSQVNTNEYEVAQ
ncbi:MAG: hypothetical protein A2719_05500 [Candidatus Ryanbacteria bacterium RIFCSPHIGHO2_01_FULL_45_22]|uniref:DUF11 domain-containing protein n=1 Tax=Candidatus Ryanbacteria bacterium RIFCSPHIGHO2_01_FULL_45_22 TaxID=1802114 RepID=A0A1G2G000_9BACT|nr:MAG: hypothetical protein A2719_05500 [Candidatus Ryanbacteria bacterium RIFCSPHIGHO2_01_FULL_45_22]